MYSIDPISVDGRFVLPEGDERAPLFNPATEEQIGAVRLADAHDIARAVETAKRGFSAMLATGVAERIDMLQRLHDAVAARADDLTAAMVEEYGSPAAFTGFSVARAPSVFLDMAQTLETFPFRRTIGRAEVEMRPAGVAAAITPWNSNYGFICSKLATAIAAARRWWSNRPR